MVIALRQLFIAPQGIDRKSSAAKPRCFRVSSVWKSAETLQCGDERTVDDY